MTFVNPLLLFGAGLVALPILLHLIMRRRPRHLEFPALRLIRRRQRANQRRLRLRHLLLLALRVAAILLLAAAMARPSVKFSGAWGSQERPVAAALVFDTSMRMEYRHENETRLEHARKMGLWLLRQLPAESEIAVLDTRPGAAAFQVDRGAAKHRIERLEAVPYSEPLTARLEEGLRLLGRSDLPPKEVYVFTDLARAAWPAETSGRLQETAGQLKDLGVYIIDVGVEEPTNTALGRLRLSRETLSGASPLAIRTELSHAGPPCERTVELYLRDGAGGWQKRSDAIASLAAGSAEEIEFHLGALDPGTHQGYVEIVGQDGLACDDRRYFTVEVRRPWPVLLAAPPPAEHHAFFLHEMLAPAEDRKSGRARFDCDVVDQAELVEKPLDGYAVVCLVDPGAVEPAVWQKLGDFAAEGGGVAVLLGPHARQVESFNDETAQELLAGKLTIQARRPDGDTYLSPRDLQHPVLATFRGLGGSVPWDALVVFRYWQLANLHKGVHVIVPYTDNRPAILERPLGAGRAITMTTPVSVPPGREPWNLLPFEESGVAVILLNEMMTYLAGGSDQKLNYASGETVVLQLDREDEYGSYALSKLDDPDGLELRLTPDLKRHLLVVAATEAPGNYRVQAGGTGGVDRGFSINLAPEQTELGRITEEELAELLGPLEHRVARRRDELERNVAAGRVGRELFGMLVLMLVAVLAGEHLLANRFYKES